MKIVIVAPVMATILERLDTFCPLKGSLSGSLGSLKEYATELRAAQSIKTERLSFSQSVIQYSGSDGTFASLFGRIFFVAADAKAFSSAAPPKQPNHSHTNTHMRCGHRISSCLSSHFLLKLLPHFFCDLH